MVAKFERAGICFQYPDNWTLSDEEGTSPSRCVTLQSPESGFWMLQVFDEANKSDEMASETLRSVRQEYQDVEVTELRQEIASIQTIGYGLQFYCLDFVVSARVLSFSIQDRTCVAFCQAEDREFDKVWPVFLAIMTSLLQAT